MIISIASGKGGTGKTSLALMLAAARSSVTLIDCDVEEPNCHLFLKPQWQSPEQEVSIMIPRLDPDQCNGCGACSDVCLFNAIAMAGGKGILFGELCHGCGGCLLACKSKAISEDKKPIGVITTGISPLLPSVCLLSGRLNVGLPSAVPLIRALKQNLPDTTGDVLIDCPPGTSCSLVTAVKNSDFCLLVTEPNPFGRHDLELTINLTGRLKLPAGVVINKCDEAGGDNNIEMLCRGHHLPVLGKIPHSLSFAEQYAAGTIPQEFRPVINNIWRQIELIREAQP